MKRVLLFILMTVCFVVYSEESKKKTQEDEVNHAAFRPVDPINYIYPIGYFSHSNTVFYKLFYDKLSLKEAEQYGNEDDSCFIRENRNIYFSDIPKEKIVDLLPNETVEVQITEITREGGLEMKGTAALSAKNTSYQITMDYVKFVTVNVVERNLDSASGIESSKIYSYARVGVGLRLVASITTKEAGINLGDLFAIGFAATSNKVSGSLSVNVLGIEAPEITSLLPMPSEISASSIQNAMQAMATIKSKLYDSDIELNPQIISIRAVKPNVKTEDLVYNTSQVLSTGLPSLILSTNEQIKNLAPDVVNCSCNK
jgi:hypothetical protein